MAESMVGLMVHRLGGMMIAGNCFLTSYLRQQVQRYQICLRTMTELLNNAIEKVMNTKEAEEIVEFANETEHILDEIEVISCKSRSCRWERERSIVHWLWHNLEQVVVEIKMAQKMARLIDSGWDLCRRLEIYKFVHENVTVGKSDVLLDAIVSSLTWGKSVFPMLEKFSMEMENEKAKLVSDLVNGELAVSCRTIAIYGISGMGKTILANKVCADGEIRKYFQGVVMASVGSNFRLGKILRDILPQLGLSRSPETMAIFSDLELIEKLYESLQSKRYLLVLDDINGDAWECLRMAIPSETCQSRVMITTRDPEVAKKISAEKGMVLKMTSSEGLEFFSAEKGIVHKTTSSDGFENHGKLKLP